MWMCALQEHRPKKNGEQLHAFIQQVRAKPIISNADRGTAVPTRDSWITPAGTTGARYYERKLHLQPKNLTYLRIQPAKFQNCKYSPGFLTSDDIIVMSRHNVRAINTEQAGFEGSQSQRARDNAKCKGLLYAKHSRSYPHRYYARFGTIIQNPAIFGLGLYLQF